MKWTTLKTSLNQSHNRQNNCYCDSNPYFFLVV